MNSAAGAQAGCLLRAEEEQPSQDLGEAVPKPDRLPLRQSSRHQCSGELLCSDVIITLLVGFENVTMRNSPGKLLMAASALL